MRARRPRPSPATLPDSIRFIASCCDGAVRRDGIGFKRDHVAVGHWLARLPDHQWDQRAVRLARTLVLIYRVQLERAGYDANALLSARRRSSAVITTIPGWAPDPAQLFASRFWDGARWTHHVR